MDDRAFGFVLGIGAIAAAVIMILVGHSVTQFDIKSHCDDYGRVKIDDRWYECRPEGKTDAHG